MRETRVALPGPRMPADHGLTGLGFIMMLGGAIYTLLMGLMIGMFLMTILVAQGAFGQSEWFVLAFCTLSLARSIYHLRAGKSLLYGFPNGATGPTWTYVMVAGFHTVIGGVLLYQGLDGAFAPWLAIVAMLAAWPIVVAALALRTPVARSTDARLPLPADLGYESLSVLMTVFGLIGTVLMAAAIIGIVQTGAMSEPLGFLFVCVLGLLLARSLLHARAGITGLRDGSREIFATRATGYTRIGIISSVVAGLWFLIVSLQGGAPGTAILIMLLYVALLVWLLMSWPRIVGQFLVDRRSGTAERRAADRGMTALGWLMLALATPALAGQLAVLITGAGGLDSQMFMTFGMMGTNTDNYHWIALGANVVQVWAGIELVRMTARYRAAAVLYGVVGLVTTVIVNFETLRELDRLGFASFSPNAGGSALGMFVGVIAALILPSVAVVLALRPEQPQARVVRGG